MNRSLRSLLPVICAALALAGCGNKETKDALLKASVFSEQGQFQTANDILVAALREREGQIRTRTGTPTNQKEADALTRKVQGDSEILKLERAQIPVYLNMERPDLASAVYTDIVAGNPGDTIIYVALEDKNPKLRIGAARVLGLTGKAPAIGALIKAARDSDQDVRRAAVAALGAIKDPQAVPPLIEALKDSYWFVRSEAAGALGQQKDLRAVQPLLDTVADEDATVESSAENALILLSSVPQAPAEPFAAKLEDPNPKLQVISAACLAILKDPRAVPTLLKLAKESNPQMRLHAIKALGSMNDPAAVECLRQSLKDPEVNVRGWSIIGLGRQKDTASVPVLTAIAADTKETTDIRAAAAAAVKHITEPKEAANPVGTP